MHKVYEAGKINRFSEDAFEDVGLRYEALLKWMDDCCERLSSSKVLELTRFQHETDSSQLFKHTMALLMDDPSRILLTEDWFHIKSLNIPVLMCDCNEFLMLP